MPDGLATFLYSLSRTGADIIVGLVLSLAIAILFIRARAHQLKLPRLSPAPPRTDAESLPDCMVVIPARNEAGFIGRSVRSLPHDSVIVVDDFSDDATAEEARQAGAGVIKAPKLARGCYGKPNACIVGARTLSSRWILFTDADTSFEPAFVDAAVACAEASGVAQLSIYLDPEYGSLWERILGPYLAALFFCGANPRSDTPAAFNGQCLLVRRDAYIFLGGHAAAINDVNEDIRLAAIVIRHRLKFGIVRANGLGHARWRDLRGMVERGAYRFMVAAPMRGTTVMITAFLMALWLPVLAWMIFDAQYRAAIAIAALPFLVLWRWYPRGTASLVALTIPVATYAVIPLLVRGVWSALSGGASEWKGRRV